MVSTKKLFLLPQLLVLAVVFSLSLASPILAQANQVDCPDGTIPVSIEVGGTNCVPENQGGALTDNPIVVLLREIITFLNFGVGLVVAGGIVYGGVLYGSSRDNASQTKQGVDIIRNSLIGLFLYLGMFAILNFLIPGGILT